MHLKHLIPLLPLALFTLSVQAENPVKDTQDIIRNTKTRTDSIKALGGTEKENNEIYGLAADIFGNLANEQGGDPEKMEKVLQNAMTNPEGFANSLTPEQKKKLRDISEKLPSPKALP